MGRWHLVYDVMKSLGENWTVDASGEQDAGYWAALVSGPGAMELFFKSPKSGEEQGWLLVTGRFSNLDEALAANISITLRESLGGEMIAKEIAARFLPLYEDFLTVIQKHNSQIRNDAVKESLTEKEAALQFVGLMLEKAQHIWPNIRKDLKEAFKEKFVVENETMATFDLYLAAIAQNLEAVKNLFPTQQADRIEKWVLKCIGQTEDWGTYAVDEVKEYGAAFQKELRIGVEFALGAIPGRLLHRWLGEGIKNFEVEIGGTKTGHIDVMLMSMTTSALAAFIGFWKNIKVNFELIEGDLPPND